MGLIPQGSMSFLMLLWGNIYYGKQLPEKANDQLNVSICRSPSVMQKVTATRVMLESSLAKTALLFSQSPLKSRQLRNIQIKFCVIQKAPPNHPNSLCSGLLRSQQSHCHCHSMKCTIDVRSYQLPFYRRSSWTGNFGYLLWIFRTYLSNFPRNLEITSYLMTHYFL